MTVDIGNDVKIGDLVMIVDSDFHVPGDFHAAAKPRPIRIGHGVRIGHRVVVLPGSTLGDGAAVKAGSVVAGVVAEGATVEGNPARMRGTRVPEPTSGSTEEDVRRLVMQVLALSRMPDPTAGPRQIPEWDSLGALRVVIAVEEQFGVALHEDQLKASHSIRDLAKYVESARLRDVDASHLAEPANGFEAAAR